MVNGTWFTAVLQLRGGIAQGVPGTATISDLLCVSHVTSNHS
jgi:hypothetical protein